MSKTSVYLRPIEVMALRRTSIRTGRSQADLVRQGIRMVALAEVEGRLEEDPPLPRDVFQWQSAGQSLEREEQVLVAYVASGCTWAEIADLTGLAEPEVVAWWARVWQRLNPVRHPILPTTSDPLEARRVLQSVWWDP